MCSSDLHGSSDPEECRATGASVGVSGIVVDIGRRVGDFYTACYTPFVAKQKYDPVEVEVLVTGRDA